MSEITEEQRDYLAVIKSSTKSLVEEYNELMLYLKSKLNTDDGEG